MFSVIQLPGSNDDRDLRFALKSVLGAEARLVWHKEAALPTGTAAGLGPISIDAAPDSSRVYTANHDSGNFSIIQTGNDSFRFKRTLEKRQKKKP